MLLGLISYAQSPHWDLVGNNGTNSASDFLGTDDAARLTLRTNNEYRFVLNEDESYTLGAFGPMPAYGFLGISPNSDFWSNGPGPFSRLHMADGYGDNVQALGYRPWMRNGITFTGNGDLMYIGQKYTYDDPDDHESGELPDYTDAIVQWSDNPGTWLSDRMRFIFTSEYDASPTGNSSLEGLEGMQLFPHENAAEILVGIGDFFAAADNPSERLDVLTGRTRIRELPDAGSQDDALTKIVVVDDAASSEYGVLKWRDASTLLDCDWEADVPNKKLLTAYLPSGTNGSCPDEDWNLFVGTQFPLVLGEPARLNVLDDIPSAAGDNWAIVAQAGGAGSARDVAVSATADGFNANNSTISLEAYGLTAGASNAGYVAGVTGHGIGSLPGVTVVHGVVAGATVTSESIESYGVWSLNNAVGEVTDAYGVWTKAQSSATVTNSYGVKTYSDVGLTSSYGLHSTCLGGQANNSWAAWFEGDVMVNGSGIYAGTWTWSDQSLKTNDAPISDAVGILAQLEPKTYEYMSADYPGVDFPTGTQAGFIAQELELVLPHLVKDARFTTQYDTAGVMTQPGFDFKAVNYDGLIPYLVQAINEQQSLITSLQDQVNGCCTEGIVPTGGLHDIGYIDNALTPAAQANNPLAKDDLVVIPNPFQENPTISYRIGTTGRAQLRVSSSEGRDMGLLFDAGMQAGQHTLVWNTTGMAVGTYWLTLTLDGVRITEQAVKVQ